MIREFLSTFCSGQVTTDDLRTNAHQEKPLRRTEACSGKVKPLTKLLRDDRGSVSIFVAICLVALMGLIALVFDGVGKINAQERLDDIAAEAARAGAQGVDPTLAIPGTTIKVAPDRAITLADDYLRQYKLTGQVTVDPAGTEIDVQINSTYTPLFAGSIANLDLGVTGHGHADLVYRVDKP